MSESDWCQPVVSEGTATAAVCCNRFVVDRLQGVALHVIAPHVTALTALNCLEYVHCPHNCCTVWWGTVRVRVREQWHCLV